MILKGYREGVVFLVAVFVVCLNGVHKLGWESLEYGVCTLLLGLFKIKPDELMGGTTVPGVREVR